MKKEAKWRAYLTDQEREELLHLEADRALAVERYRVLFRLLKDRCIKRMRRAGD